MSYDSELQPGLGKKFGLKLHKYMLLMLLLCALTTATVTTVPRKVCNKKPWAK